MKDYISNVLDFDIIPGGMVTGARVGPVSQKARYLQKRVREIERITGIAFGERFHRLLKEGKYISDSIPPSRAFLVFKSIRPARALELGHAIQKAHYWDGEDLNSMRPYFNICDEFEINKRAFLDRFNDPLFNKQTLAFFEQAKTSGVENFPAIVLKDGKKSEILQKGYTKFLVLEKMLLDRSLVSGHNS